MADKRAYAVLLSDRNSQSILMTREFLDALGDKNKCAFVAGGFDLTKYVGCIVFKTKKQRDEAAERMDEIGIIFDKRDDALIDENFWNYLE